jgi:chromosome segregation ATPase
MAVLPAPLLSEADIKQYQRTCATGKVAWEQVLRLRKEAEKLAPDIENMKGISKRLTQEIVSRGVEIGQLVKDAEDKKAADEQLKKEINSRKAEYAGLEQKIKLAQQELSTIRQQVKEEGKRKPAAPEPPKPVPLKSGFCGKCGTRCEPRDIFCGHCGKRLE